ncbi:hypothetical protein CRE_16055 [Caenorhabditis remanei]|uniref:Calpain catalytic domain-containing protein n=1 Tax=Caenorhabditis remanei TaxID=31234 RepID=E3MBK8_CAERE|nr:hypothetical protein CRE_16055 [Caenorhabditis remanei]
MSTVSTTIKSQEDGLPKECEEWVQLFLKDFGPDEVFFDAEFDFSNGSLKWDEHGTVLNYKWLKRQAISIYNDTWSFHAEQGGIGDCWLIAPLMTIARRQKLLEWIIPPTEYSLKHGIFLVRLIGILKTESLNFIFRLFFNGEWQIVVVDGHLPLNEKGFAQFAYTFYDRLWPCLIEKAVAKMLGGYHKLNGGNPISAFKYLTGLVSKYSGRSQIIFKGSSCLRITLNKDTDLDMLWTKLKEYQSCGFLMTLSSPEKYEDFSKKGLANNHVYSLLDTCIHEGHRLVLIGATNDTKWKGKWSELPAFNEQTTRRWRNFEKQSVEERIAWMEVNDLWQRFEILLVYWLILDPENGLVETDSFDLDPGNYFIIFTFISEKLPFEYEFTIKSSSPIDHISYDFVTFENSSASHKSLLKMIESEKCGIEIRKGLVLHEYSRDNFLLLMAENKTKNPIFISVIAKCDLKLCSIHGIDSEDFVKLVQLNAPADQSAVYLTIPAKSKCVIRTVWTLPDRIKLEKQPKKPEISCKYWIRIFEEEMKKNKWMKKIPKELEKYIYRSTIYKPIPIN